MESENIVNSHYTAECLELITVTTVGIGTQQQTPFRSEKESWSHKIQDIQSIGGEDIRLQCSNRP